MSDLTGEVLGAGTLSLFVAVGAGSTVATSPDGVNWTSRSTSFGVNTVQCGAWTN